MEMTFELFGKIVASVGGAGVIICGVSALFGNFMANSLLARSKAKYDTELEEFKKKHQDELLEHKAQYDKDLEDFKKERLSELEEVKHQYSEQLEAYKYELDRTKTLFARYTEKQFTLYNDLWKSLCELKNSADILWDNVTNSNVTKFAKQLKKTISEVEKNRLILEEEHYMQLTQLFIELKQFEVGKKNLLDFSDENNLDGTEFEEFRRIIESNRRIKNQYNVIIDNICRVFKTQIREG